MEPPLKVDRVFTESGGKLKNWTFLASGRQGFLWSARTKEGLAMD